MNGNERFRAAGVQIPSRSLKVIQKPYAREKRPKGMRSLFEGSRLSTWKDQFVNYIRSELPSSASLPSRPGAWAWGGDTAGLGRGSLYLFPLGHQRVLRGLHSVEDRRECWDRPRRSDRSGAQHHAPIARRAKRDAATALSGPAGKTETMGRLHRIA